MLIRNSNIPEPKREKMTRGRPLSPVQKKTLLNEYFRDYKKRG